MEENQNSLEQIQQQWEQIQNEAPTKPKCKPSAEQLVVLQMHKQRVKAFLSSLSPEERILIQGSPPKKGDDDKKKDKKKKKGQSNKKQQKEKDGPPTLKMTPKSIPLNLGWGGDDDNDLQTYNQVLPFYSHKNRSKLQEEEDNTTFNGFDRRVCSNLYFQNKPLYVPKLLDSHGNNLMKWDFLSTTPGPSSENFFQAAKCTHECDARFLMMDLNPYQAAEYGQSRMGLTTLQKERLVELGADPNDFKRIESFETKELNHGKKLSNNGKLISSMSKFSSEEDDLTQVSVVWWVRGKDGLLPRRDDWEDVKAHVMLHIVRHKFKGMNDRASAAERTSMAPAAASTTTVTSSTTEHDNVDPAEAVRALLSLPSIPLFVEHTKNDVTWADGGDGSGFNLLGKAITQVLLELSGKLKPAPLRHTNLDSLRRPTKQLVDYSWPEITRPSSSSKEKNGPAIDYLCILDFEATCNENGPAPKPQEIIEFPTLLLNTKTGKVEQEFHFYIKPDVHLTLSKFCTDLTGITQDQVDSGISLKDALYQQQQWLDSLNLQPYNATTTSETNKKKDLKEKYFLFVTCGDWDLSSCLPKQLRHHNRKVPSVYRRWINVKHAFRDLYKLKPMGMTHMLRLLDMELIGRHHSGIDDCRNIARICSKMLEDGWDPKQTNS